MARVTINMIAEKAGVSRGTVDRVLHNRQDVSPEVREHVLAVAKIMGYLTAPQESKDQKLIGVILPGNRWFDDYLKKEWMQGLEDAREIVEPLGYHVELAECETDISVDIISAAEELLKKKPAGIAMTGMDTRGVRECIDRIVDSGIPVVTYNSDLAETKRSCFIGQDLYRSGRVAANMIFPGIGKEDKILAVAGNLDYAAHNSRIKGFTDACREAGIKDDQIAVRESHNEYFLTYEIVKAALADMPDLRAIYMANESVPACAEALADEKTDRRVLVVGNDLTGATRRLLMEGAVDFIIEQNIYWQGYQPIVTLKKLIEMPAFPIEENAFTNISVVNAESIRRPDTA